MFIQKSHQYKKNLLNENGFFFFGELYKRVCQILQEYYNQNPYLIYYY